MSAANPQPGIAELCQSMAHFSPTPLIAVEGADHSVSYVNPAFTKLVRKAKEDLIGTPFNDTVPSGGECVLMLDRVFRTGEPAVYTRAEHSAPNPFFWSYVMWPLKDKLGRTLGIIVQITESSDSHQQYTSMNEALLLGALRQHELTQAAEVLTRTSEDLILRLQAEMAERKNAEGALVQSAKLATVGVMAATLAHELNNPLESLTNLIYLAQQDTQLSTKAQGYLAEAEEELARVAHMAKQTLGLYRESATHRQVLMSELLSHLIAIFSSKIKNKQIVLALEVESEIPIFAVAGELRQIFANLLGNGIDAVATGGRIRIKISTVKGLRPGVRVTFGDNGAGISKADMGRIFQAFFTTKVTVGTGLGLWVSKQIIDRYKGAIRVRSCTVPGRCGTVASVFLPSGEES